MFARSLLIGAAVLALTASLPRPAAGVVLTPGDLVVVGWENGGGNSWTVWKVDPATFERTFITSAGLLSNLGRAMVAPGGTIYVASRTSGLVAIDPATGGQSLVASPSDLGGRAPEGVALAPDSGLYISATGGGSGAILHLDLGTRALRVVSEGGLLSNPTCIAVAPGGVLYVGERERSAVPTPIAPTKGSIVRVDPTGAQTLIAGADETNHLFYGPIEIGLAPDGSIWSVQFGHVARRQSLVIRTSLIDGSSSVIEGSPTHGSGLAFLPGGITLLNGCYSGTGPDCHVYKVYQYPDGPPSLFGAWVIAVVPAASTPVHHQSWGSLKARYR